MYMLDSRQDSAMSGILEEDNVHFDSTAAPANSAIPTPILSVSQEYDYSQTNTHHRRDSGPHLEKFVKLVDIIECPNDVMCCKFTPDGTLLTVGLIDGIILIYNHHDNQLLYSLQDEDILKENLPVTQIRFPVFPLTGVVEENRLLASYITRLLQKEFGAEGRIYFVAHQATVPLVLSCQLVCDFDHFYSKGKQPLHVDNYECPSTKMASIVLSSITEKMIDASGHIKLWHYTSGSCLNTMTENRQSLNVTYSPDGKRLITTGETPEILVYDRETRKIINILEPSETQQKLDGHCFRVFAAQYHPEEPHLFLSGGWDDTVHYWDDRKKHSIRQISGPHICGDAIDIDPVSKNQVLTGSWRRKFPLEITDTKCHTLLIFGQCMHLGTNEAARDDKVWDFNTGKKLKDIPSEPNCHSQLYCCQWLAKESVLCGGSDGNMAKVINWSTLSTKGLLTDLSQGVYCIDNDRIGCKPFIAVGSKNKLYLIKPEKDF